MISPKNKVRISRPKNFSPVPIEAIQHSVADRFETVVELYPDNIVVSENNRQVTFLELNESANRLANSILASVQEGDLSPIPFLLEYGVSSIVTLLALMKTGHPYVPLNPTFPVARNNLIISDMGAKLLVTDSQHNSMVKRFQSARNTLAVLDIDSLDPSASLENPGIVIAPKDLLNISYTSGSTGTPKGGISNQQYWTYQISFRVNEWYISPEDRIPLLSNFSFGASLGPILYSFFSGAQLCLFDFNSENLIDTIGWLKREKVTMYSSTPSTFRTIFGEMPESSIFEHLRIVSLAGEPVSKHDVALFRAHTKESCILTHGLASTEAGGLTRYWVDHTMVVDEDILPVGFPMAGKEVALLDDDGNQVAQGQAGEIVVTSRYLRSGYWNLPALTEKKFQLDPNDSESRILYTGDMGRWRADGALVFLGRKDNMIKIRGFRIETGEVEMALHKHPIVKEVVVIGQAPPHAPENKQLVAYIVPRRNQSVSGKDLRQFMAETVPDYMIPSRFTFLDAIPLNPNGKLDRQLLSNIETDRPNLSTQYVEPKNELETRLTAIWEELLGISPIGTLDNFFELGGDSLLAMRLFLRIEDVFGKKFPLSILVEASNIQQQATILAEDDFQPNWSPLVPVQPDGDRTPVFCLAGKGGNPLRFRLFAELIGEKNPVYFMQARGLSGKEQPGHKIEEIATDYLSEIQKIYPHGPYHFIGSSFGGNVAYEMARQLSLQGNDMGIVALLDTFGPSYPTYKSGYSRFLIQLNIMLKTLRKHFFILFSADLKSKREYFRYYRDFLPMEISRRFQNIRLWKEKNKFDELPPELRSVENASYSAVKRYDPPEYTGEVILFRAKHQLPGVELDPLLGWGKIKIGNLVVHEVDSFHGNILFHPAISDVYRFLQPFLEKYK